MNTTWSGLSLTVRITRSVNVSHPLPWCDAACPARTVSVVLSSSTPWRAQRLEVPMRRDRHAEVARQLLVDVDERRRDAHPAVDREAQPVGLLRAVVRILAEDHHLGVGVRREVERGEHLVVRRVHHVRRPLGGDERLQVAPVRLGRTRPAGAGSSRSRPSPRLPSMSRVTASPPRAALATLPDAARGGSDVAGRGATAG